MLALLCSCYTIPKTDESHCIHLKMPCRIMAELLQLVSLKHCLFILIPSDMHAFSYFDTFSEFSFFNNPASLVPSLCLVPSRTYQILEALGVCFLPVM